MPKRTKSLEDISQQVYLNITDISRLFGLIQIRAKKLYEIASEIDAKELGPWRIEPFKVRASTVYKVVGVDPSFVHKIKGTAGR